MTCGNAGRVPRSMQNTQLLRMGAQNWITLRDPREFVEQSAGPAAADDPDVSAQARFGQRPQRCRLAGRAVWTMLNEVPCRQRSNAARPWDRMLYRRSLSASSCLVHGLGQQLPHIGTGVSGPPAATGQAIKRSYSAWPTPLRPRPEASGGSWQIRAPRADSG
jgi:hypothetical protein